MLKQSEGGIFIPQHAMNMNWFSMLTQAFGVAELQYLPDLKALCNERNTTIASNALTLLVAFGEPDVIPIIMDRISHEDCITVRDSLIRLIAEMRLPQSVVALKTLKAEAVSRGIFDTLESRLLKEVVPPEKFDPMMTDDAVRITNSNLRMIFLNNLLYTCGSDMSYVHKTIFLSVNKSDIPVLRRIRSSIMRRMSDEAIYDYQSVSYIINWLQWQE
jgi:hypothetical protein